MNTCKTCKCYDAELWKCNGTPNNKLEYHSPMDTCKRWSPKPGWISVKDAMPPERDSWFAKLKGTDKWSPAMFEKASDPVIVTVENENGYKSVREGHTTDGKWRIGNTPTSGKVLAWQPMPEPYERGEIHGILD